MERKYSISESVDVPLGEVWLSQDVQEAIEQYPGDTVVQITFDLYAMWLRYLELGYSEEELDGMEKMVWALFEEAGYTIHAGVKYNFLYATLDQIREMECSEHVAIYFFFKKHIIW